MLGKFSSGDDNVAFKQIAWGTIKRDYWMPLTDEITLRKVTGTLFGGLD